MENQPVIVWNLFFHESGQEVHYGTFYSAKAAMDDVRSADNWTELTCGDWYACVQDRGYWIVKETRIMGQ